jgi:putative ABC transport system permease protein
MILRVAVRGLLARRARVALTVLSIVIGVSFVSGAFIVTDSFRRAFDGLFAELDRGIDLRVRGATAFGRGGGGNPVPAELADRIAAIDGVTAVEPSLDEPAVVLDADGEPVPALSGPQLGIAWTGDGVIGGRVLRSGVPPNGIDEVALDETTAERIGAELGDRVRVAMAGGVREFTLVGTTGLGASRGQFAARATIAAFDPVTAQEVLGSPGRYDSIDVAVADGQDAAVAAAITALLPPDAEVVDGDQVARESAERIGNAVDLFRWVLLGFALIALFVSAFLIDNTFRIIIGQRLRELALLRAVGAGARQVQAMILGESLVLAIAATAIGLLGGVGVAEVLTRVFNAGGIGFPAADTVIAPRTVLVAVAVGVGVTMAATLAPAVAAGRVPPVAAMHLPPQQGRGGSSRRYLAGAALMVMGVLVYAVGVLRTPGALTTVVAVIAVGGGAVLAGMALLAAGVATPVARVLGRPVRGLLGMPGRLAQENAVRSPRRTATTASALMIGIALVGAVGVVGASLSRSLTDQLGQSVTADVFITTDGFRGFTPEVVDRLRELPEIDAISGFRSGQFQVSVDGADAGERPVGAVDAASFPEIVDVGLVSGGFDGLADDGLLVHEDPAGDLDLAVGDRVDVLWRSGTRQTLHVVGVFSDATAVNANWLVDIDVFARANPASARDAFAGATIAEGVDLDTALAAIGTVVADFPQVQVQDQAEFRQTQEDQLDQLLRLVYGLLAFAVLIAVLGITNTLALAVFERTHEFGLLRAVGATRRQLQLAVFGESVIVAAFGTTLGLAVGLPMGALGTRGLSTVGVTSVVLPLGTIAVVVAATLVAGVVAAIWPARRAGRLDVLAAIARPE